MLALVRRARRRILHNLLFEEGSNAASAALAAFILLLILGTQVLNWYWLVLLPAAAAVYAVWRVRQRLPDLYKTAQRVDGRMRLADTLSTAVYFSSEQTRGPAELRRSQLAEAERLARGIEVRRAIPYAVPRTAYATGALLLVASSLFALRYGLTDRLDLKKPLARLVRDGLGLPECVQAANLDERIPKSQNDDLLKGEQEQPADPVDATQPNDPVEDQPETPPKSAAKADGKNKNGQAQSDSDQDGQADPSEQPADSQQQDAANQSGDKQAQDSQNGGSNSQSRQNNQSLLGKVKEAMQNLLSSMKQDPRDQQSASNQNGKSSKGQQNQAKQQTKGEKSKSQSGDSQDQQSADEGQQAQNSPGQSTDQQDSPLANKQPGSGAGNRDGAKDIRQAQQLAAMGKISEIIGKRAANVTGEATVDVQSTSQQLRTGYQDRQADHSQSGAEIHRDEIPVALESYVEQYFEQVRKQAAPKK
ncbi:MAG TPA: hypothetical protein VKV17_15725 [Bryobacteraceae bacterium]|nr:hypothetical protein [Bryobacteraceae bacterium]